MQACIVTATQQYENTNTPDHSPTTTVCTHEEADTLILQHGIEVAHIPGNEVDLFTHDRDCMLCIDVEKTATT